MLLHNILVYYYIPNSLRVCARIMQKLLKITRCSFFSKMSLLVQCSFQAAFNDNMITGIQ